MSPGRCFVEGCVSYKYEGKITFFSAPKNAGARKIWNEILKHPTKILEPSHYVCEKHFDPNDVLKGLHVNEITLPNKITRLRKGCVPLPFIKQENPDPIPDEMEYENKFEMTHLSDDEDDDTKVMPEFVNIASDDFLKNPCKMEEIPDVEVKLEPDMELDNFFDELFENKYIFGLTEYWGIHSCEPKTPPPRPCMVLLVNTKKPKSIIFSQVNTRDGFPVYEKQVILNEQLEISYFVAKTVVNVGLPNVCASMEELCNAINKYSELILCRGGPGCEEYKEIIHITNCAYKDLSSRTWRHKNCLFFTQSDMQPCLFCQALPKYFKTALKKSKKLKRLKKEMGPNVEEWYFESVPKKKIRKET